MKRNLSLLVSILLSFSAVSQRASDIIENGIKVKEGNEIFVKFDGTRILYQVNTLPNDLRFKQIEDSAMLLPVDRSVNFFIRPLNPLNYAFKAENKVILDPVDAAASTALTSVIDFLSSKLLFKTDSAAKGKKQVFCDLSKAIAAYNTVVTSLKEDPKEKIKSIFSDLKQLSFNTEQETRDGISKAEADISAIAKTYSTLPGKIDILKDAIKNISCDDPNAEFISKEVFATVLKDVMITYSGQAKRFTNLDKVFKLVKKTQEEASRLNWLVKIDEVPATKGKISIFTIKINESGYKLADDEIVEADTKEKTAKVLRIRNFQRFVPEVSVGIAYTDLSFPKYGTTTDAAGKQVVTLAGEEKINKVNFTTMINYTLFLTNSPVHPFWQIGIGANTDFPTFLTGIGGRLNAGPKRLAIAAGIATTWIKSLNKLELNKVVSGPAEVENDVKFKFNNKPKPYLGIQYNF